MALTLSPRAERLLARLPRLTVYSALELLLLVLLAVQSARLFWAVLTPLGPMGAYRLIEPVRAAPATMASLSAFDPFFRGQQQQVPAQTVVTSLDIRLFGTRENRATGGGTAFIAGADGTQRSYEVGEEIMPGVRLVGVGFDYVTIERGGATERLFLDQSPAAAPGAAGAPGAPGAPGTTVRVQPVPPASSSPPAQPVQVAPPPPPPPQPVRVNR